MSTQLPQSSFGRLGDAWNTYGMGGAYWQGPSTIKKIQETCDSVQNVLSDPSFFFAAATQGILAGAQGTHPTISNSSAQAGKSPNQSLLEKLSHIATQGASLVSLAALEQLLNNAETYDLDSQDVKLKEACLDTIKKAKDNNEDLSKTAKEIWQILNKYHLLVGGFNANVKTSSNEAMRAAREIDEGVSKDGVSPIHSLVRCQESYRMLRKRYEIPKVNLQPVGFAKVGSASRQKLHSNALEKLKEFEIKTDKIVRQFAHKTLHFTTIYAIHYLFKHDTDPAEYKKDIEKGGDIKRRYLERFGKGTFSYYFYKCIYTLICWFIRPIMAPTIKQLVKSMRSFLKNDINLLKFIEQKIDDMKNYYGRIEKGRKDYLYSQRSDEAGSFGEYLEQSIKIYGGKYTEQNLIKIFNKYIVQNFVPWPNITLFGKRIPLLSSFLEWVVHSIRKGIIAHALKKTHLVERLLTQGSGSVHYAQLGLKRILEEKLTQIVEMVDLQHSSTAQSSTTTTFSNDQPELTIKKSQLITRQRHLKNQQLSEKLLRFIDIESCNEDDSKLRNLDNRVSNLFSDTIKAVGGLVKHEFFSLEEVLKDASTDILETATVSLFEDKEMQTEKQLHTIFEVFDKSFTYIPPDERAEVEKNFNIECALVDENLNTLQEQLARSAVAVALEKHLKNVSGEKHNSIKAYVGEEQKTLSVFTEELISHGTSLQQVAYSNDSYKYDPEKSMTSQINTYLSQMVSFIEHYLGHLSIQLRSPQLENCYNDTRGDLHNSYANIIYSLKELQTSLESVAAKIAQINKDENGLAKVANCQKFLSEVSIKHDYDETKRALTQAYKAAPKCLHPQIKEQIRNLSSVQIEYSQNERALQNFDRYVQMKNFEIVERNIKQLQKLCIHYQDPKKMQEKLVIRQKAFALLGQIKASEDPLVQKYILPHLKSSSIDALCNSFKTPIFSRGAPLKMEVEKMKKLYQSKLHSLSKKFPILTTSYNDRSCLVAHKQDLANRFKKEHAQVSEILEKYAETKTKEIQENLKTTEKVFAKCLGEIAIKLDYIKKEGFDVKGCISVGQIQLYQTIVPKAIALISPKIIEGTRTLVDAMGKPSHYKQLVLRLLFLDIARRESAT